MFEGFKDSYKKEQEKDLESLPQADVLVVLSHETERGKSGEIVPSLESKMRTIAALELYKRGYAKRIMFSGGRAKEFPNEKSRAEVMKDYIERYGIPAEDVLTEDVSQNTSENLDKVLDILDKDPEIKSILIETNEYHLNRAHDLFENILKKHNLSSEQKVFFVAAEHLLDMRSPHYKKLTSAYKFPESLKNAPFQSIEKGLREFLRRVLIFVDKDDRLARFLVQKLRAPKKRD